MLLLFWLYFADAFSGAVVQSVVEVVEGLLVQFCETGCVATLWRRGSCNTGEMLSPTKPSPLGSPSLGPPQDLRLRTPAATLQSCCLVDTGAGALDDWWTSVTINRRRLNHQESPAPLQNPPMDLNTTSLIFRL